MAHSTRVLNPRPQPVQTHTYACAHAHAHMPTQIGYAHARAHGLLLCVCPPLVPVTFFFSLCHSLLPLCLLNAARGFAWRIAPRGFGIAGSPRHTRRRHTIVAAASPSWAQVNTSDFFLHKKFFELPGHVQKRMGLRDCSGDTTLAVGRCYMIANAV